MQIIRYILKSIGQGIVIGVVIAVIMIGIEVLFGRPIEFNWVLGVELLYYCFYAIVLRIVNVAYFNYLNHKVIWDRYRKYRIFIGAMGSIILTMVSIFLIRIFLKTVVDGVPVTAFIRNEKIDYYIVSFLITMVAALFFHSVHFYKESQENKVKEQKIIAGTASAKFESLKNQIDPHFLFNSLNVLSSLIEENPENAQRFTTSLSKIYRYVLEQKDKELVSLEEELSFAKTYMNLLKMRFENSLFYDLPTGELDQESKVVPLSLQLLLENTVKHNVVSEARPLHIRIFIEEDYLVIQNDYQRKDILQDRQGVGLQNIVNRYGIITNRKVLIVQDEKTFTVKIPILTKQISVMVSDQDNQNDRYFKIQKKVEDIRGFYGNLVSYIVVITGLAILNVITSTYLWFIFPAIGWGIGVLIHGLSVFNYVPFLGRDWEEKKIKELLEKERSEQWK